VAANAPLETEPATHDQVVPVPPARLPAELLLYRPRRRRWLRLAVLAVVIALAAFGAVRWWDASQNGLPAGFAAGNGRLEADEIDISTKFSGRVAAILAEEGTIVTAGQVVARMDTRDLEAQLATAEAQLRQSQQLVSEAQANIEQQKAQLRFARQEFERTQFLMPKGFASRELLDQRQQQMDTAAAAVTAANARAAVAEHALEGARHTVELTKINIADNTLVAPKDGRIQYRLANVGEVLPAGGKVFTMLDTANVYMDIFLPTAQTGHTKAGTEARIVLDAWPDYPIPATVSFVANQAQFTPKAVETRSERDKLMFRVRLRVDADLLRRHAADVRSGLPGVGYVRMDPTVAWPKALESRTVG
jgi:HlyD family secretion protein